MGGPLITLPLRVGVRSTQLLLRAGEELVVRTTSLASQAVQVVMPRKSDASSTQGGSGASSAEREHAEARAPEPRVPEKPRPVPSPPTSTAPSRRPRQVSRAPLHVSQQPEVVREVAEPGAEDGAGAEITVAEPWDGYARMSAKEVISRLGEATPAELAAVTLYENSNRGRQTVLAAVERGLKTTTGRARQTRKEQASA